MGDAIPDAAVLPLNACVVLHLLLVYLSVELFDAFDSIGADVLGRLFVLSGLVPLSLLAVFVTRRALRNRRTLTPLAMLAVSLAALYLFVALAPNGHNIDPDVALYHGPKQLMHLIAGDLNLYSSPSPQQILVISYFDNYNMALFALAGSHDFANALNVLIFALVSYNSVYLVQKLRRSAASSLLMVLLLVGMPIMFGEVFIAKNNTFGIYLFTVSCVATLWLASRAPPRRRELILVAGAQGVLFALIALGKATMSVALIPYVVLVSLYMAKRHWNDKTSLGLATLTGGGVFVVLVLPYVLRQLTGLMDAPSGGELSAWLDYWVFIPPRVGCGLYAWPQHFATMADAVAAAVGYPFDANLTPDVCTRFSTDRPFWNLAVYNEGVPVVVTVLSVVILAIAAVRRMWLEVAVFVVAILSLMLHHMIYANSVWNYRLVGVTFYALALGVALALGRTKLSWLKVGVIAVACVWSAVVVYQNWTLDHGVRDSARNTRIFGTIESDEPVSVELHLGTRLSGYFALLGLLEMVGYDWERLNVQFGNEFGGLYRLREVGDSPPTFTHSMYCLPPENVLAAGTVSGELAKRVDIGRAGCHIVADKQ